MLKKNERLIIMTQELNDHKVSPADKALTIKVLNQPGNGGAHHAYLISGYDHTRNSSKIDHQDPNIMKDL